ncbi:MAG: type II toxin-antitoxin system VapC family toxin [Dehalococcoidia bacterium]
MTELARERSLSAYDAAYLELAQLGSLPLATQGGKLIQGAQSLGVSLFG